MENFANDSSVAVSRSSSATTLNGLEEFVRYDITVQVIYNDRLGPISDEVRVVTLSSGKWNSIANYNKNHFFICKPKFGVTYHKI